MHLPDYRVWTSVSIGDGERSDALQLRTDEERERVEQRVLQEHGVEPPTLRDMIEGLPLGDVDAGEILDTMSDASADDELDLDLTPEIRATVLQAIYDEAYLSTGDGHAAIALDDAAGRVARYIETDLGVSFGDRPEEITAAQISGLLSAVPETELRRVDRDGDLLVACTPAGKLRFTSPAGEFDLDDAINDDGELDLDLNQTSGGEGHAQIMRDAYDPLLALGVRLRIHRQGGGSEPDATAEIEVAEYRSLRSNPTSNPSKWRRACLKCAKTTKSSIVSPA